MAYTSGHNEGNVIDNGCVYISWQLASQSQSGNYSRINWQYGWRFLGSPTNRQLDNGYVAINGIVLYDQPGRVRDYPLGSEGIRYYQVLSGTNDFGHDANGYLSIRLDAELAGNWTKYSELLSGWYDLPRIPKIPSAPGAPSLSVNGNAVTVSWAAPGDNGGTPITSYTVERATDAGFTANFVSTPGITGTSTTLTGLAWGTSYWFRVKATNNVGTSALSGATNTTTGITVPDAPPSAPTVSGITPVQADVAYTAPSFVGGSPITGYDIQRARDSAFTLGVVTSADSASPFTMTGLQPGTDHWVRVRAKNAAGAGAWSASRQFRTLPGVRVGNGLAWVDSLVYVGNGSGWALALVKSGNGSTWK